MHNYLAIDAGGTSTRAVLLDASGQCLGYGTAGGGNPVSRGFQPALAALLAASRQALEGLDRRPSAALVAMAGASLELPLKDFRDGFMTLGMPGNVMIESDLLAAFYSGTFHDDGLALIAGTGAVGARVQGSELAAVVDGTGWLLGDNGSGFWLGREVARAVAAALDGRGKPTALTDLVLSELEITLDPLSRTQGRLRAQQQLILKVYEQSPIELARFAPMVFAVPDDVVAKDIIERAAAELARTLLAANGAASGSDNGAFSVRDADTSTTDPAEQTEPTLACDGPVVFGGSVLTKGTAVASAVAALLAKGSNTLPVQPVLVSDGVVGAAVLVLKRHGMVVDAEVFSRIQVTLASLRDA